MSLSAKVTVKASEGKYKWSQTPEAVNISLPVKNILLKHVEILYTDFVLKVNVTVLNYVQVIDFPHEIDFQNAANKVQLTDTSLEVYLVKMVPQQWSELQYSGLKGPELTARRTESLNKYYEWQQQKYKDTQDKVYKLDGEVVKQQMKIEAHQREHIEQARQGQKTEFENELQHDLNRMEQKNTTILNEKIKRGEAEKLGDAERYAQVK